MRKTSLLLMTLVVMALMTVACGDDDDSPGSSADNPIEVKGIRAWSDQTPSVQTYYLPFIERVNEASEGRVVLSDVGGPEVAPTFEAFRPVLDDAFQMWYGHSSYHEEFTTLGNAGDLVKGDWAVREECGLIEVVRDAYEDQGMYWFGPTTGGVYKIYLNDEINSASLDGLKIRTSGLYDAFLKEMGAVPTRIPFPEIYSSLEKGVIDGAAYFGDGAYRGSWYDIVDYGVAQSLGESGGTGMLINLQTWNKIPSDIQDLMNDIYREMADANYDAATAAGDEEVRLLEAEGLEFIELPPTEAKRWTDAWYEAGAAAFVDTNDKFGERTREAMECVREKTGEA